MIHESRPAMTRSRMWKMSMIPALGGAVAATLIALAFLWPATTSQPDGIAVSVVGDDHERNTMTQVLEAEAPGVFDVVIASDAAEAQEQIRTKRTYGAIVWTDAPQIFTAPAASTAVAALLSTIAEPLRAAGGPNNAASEESVAPEITEVVDFPRSDPYGAGIAALALPLVMGGILGGIVISMRVRSFARRTTALAVFALTAGTLSALVAHSWLGVLPGAWLSNAAALALTMAGTAFLIVGAHSLARLPGLIGAVVLTLLVANPLAGVAQPWTFLPAPWGVFGQNMVPGAGNALLRAINYFPDAPTGAMWLVLLLWVLGGLTLAIVGRSRWPEECKRGACPVSQRH